MRSPHLHHEYGDERPLLGPEFNAEAFSFEGLDYLLARIPRATITTVPTTLYLGLFTGATASTVPAQSTVLSTAPVGVSEPSGGAYARVAVANTDWGAIATADTTGRKTTSAQKSFPESTASWGTVNGFFLADASTVGTSIYFANFDDTTAISVNAAGFTVRITPYYEYLG